MSLPSTSVQEFVVDPKNNQTVYAATFDLGFFKSTDGGATWKLLNTGLPTCTNCYPANSFGGRYVWVDPTSTAIFAATNSDLALSGDGGATWLRVNPGAITFSLSFDTNNPGTVYEFLYNGTYKSTDDGVTFKRSPFP